jgi:hypothetical protein
LGNPEDQQELISPEEPGEGGGEQRPWIIPVSSRANIAGVDPIAPEVELPPCSPSEAKKILRQNINWHITLFLNKQHPGNKLTHSKMLYRRMGLVCAKPVAEMNQSELEKVWLWVRKEYSV